MSEKMIQKAKKTKSVDELLALAKMNNIKLAEEQAIIHFNRLHTTGELADDELDNVVGGCGGGDGSSSYPNCITCGTNEYVTMLNPEGDYWCAKCDKPV